MTICDKIQTVGETLESNLNARGVSCTFGTGTGEKNILQMTNLITSSNLKGSADSIIRISASRPYLLSGEKTDLIVTLHDGVGTPLANKSVTISDGTSSYSGITNSLGLFTLYDVTVSADTTFTATYDTVSDSCLVEYCTFADYCTTNNNKSNGYSQTGGSYSFNDICLSLDCSNQTLNFKNYTSPVTVPFKISFEVMSNDYTPRVVFYQGNYGTAIGNATFYISGNKPTLIEYEVKSTGITRTVGASSSSVTTSAEITSTVSFLIRTNSAVTGSTKIRNFKIKAL